MPDRVIMAMSGGVDSSVAAARLVDHGFEVIGVTLHLWDDQDQGRRGRCCAPEDVHDARRVARQLGFAHYTLDRRSTFVRAVVEPFVEDYLRGATPSPCAACNRDIKIPALIRIAKLMEARWVATGHYARITYDAEGHPRIARGVDDHKDQSYFLYALGPEVIRRLMLPLGANRKSEVRQEALARGLVGAAKGESQDLCFVPDGGYADFVEQRARTPIRSGSIVDSRGALLGSHSGVHRFTVGQRKGLGVVAGRPLFVTRIDAGEAKVVVGDLGELLCSEVHVEHPCLAPALRFPLRASVRIRYRHEGAMATLEERRGALRIVFDAPVRAATVGQVAVAFDGDVVICGGVISTVVGAACEPI